MGVGVQLPKAIRDARKMLYAKVKEAKDGRRMGAVMLDLLGKNFSLTVTNLCQRNRRHQGLREHLIWNIRGARRSFLFFPGMSTDLYENCRTSTFLISFPGMIWFL